MSFIGAVDQGVVYTPGYFLAHEECERKTREFPQTGATTAANGAKYWKMGALITETSEVDDGEGGTTEVTDYIGFAYEDVDVTNGNMPGSVVLSGVVYEDRLPETLTSDAKTALEAKGFKFVETAPAVTRPNWVNGGEG